MHGLEPQLYYLLKIKTLLQSGFKSVTLICFSLELARPDRGGYTNNKVIF